MSLPLNVFTAPVQGATLIEASAGTGKTWAISGLVLRQLLEQGHPVQNVLVVTFTKAATAELRERIRARLQETLRALQHLQDFGEWAQTADPFVPDLLQTLLAAGLDVPILLPRAQAALAAFDEAPILTIHGYCQRALADAAFSAGEPFVLEQADDHALCAEWVADFWREKVLNADLPVRTLADWAQHLPPVVLTAQLRRRLARPHSQLYWPDSLPPDEGQEARLDQQWADLKQRWAEDGADAKDALLAALAARRLNAQTYKADKIEAGARAWDAWLGADSRPLEAPPEVCALWSQTLLNEKCNRNQTAPECPLFVQMAALLVSLDEAAAAQENARLGLLRELLETGPEELHRRKRARRQFSFDDLLNRLDRALRAPGGRELGATLRSRFPVALIDEFQDTDPVQFEIFRQIYLTDAPEMPTALYLVGDPKQAIYSFRQADLQTYLRARERADHRFHLADNQRSTAELIAAVNALFGAQSAAFMQPGLDFQPVGMGRKPRGVLLDQREGSAAALQVWQLPQDTLLDKTAARQAAAQACAVEIADLLRAAGQGIVVLQKPDGRCQPLQAGDLAVLVRTKDQGRLVKAALGRLGLAAAELSTQSVYATPEAAELESILWALAEPSRPGRIRAALTTRLFGLDAAQLESLNTPEAMHEWVAYLQRFQTAHQIWLRRGLAAAWQNLLAEQGVSARLLALPDGERVLTNFLHLVELLHGEETALGSTQPTVLLRHLAAYRADPGSDENAQLRLESDENLVRIVTIHRSKGLEYPVVFCPFVWEAGGGGNRKKQIGVEYPAADCEGPRCLDFRPADTPEQVAGLQRAALEAAAEDLRLLYVALTRAVHRCYLVSGPYTVRNSPKESQRALLNWLVAGAPGQAENWLAQGGDESAVQAAWQALASHCAHIRVDLLPSGNRPVVAIPPTTEASKGTCPPRPSGILPAWRIDSFTGLLRGMPEQTSVLDHDALAVQPAALDTPELSDIVRFARGARAGECLHALFEWADFSAPETWPWAIQRALAAHPLPETERAGAGLSARQLDGMLQDVLNTPLPDGLGGHFCLSSLKPAQRLNELEFSLPVGRLQASELQAVCRAHGLDLPLLAFQPLQGYLRGFMDLVFRIEGKQGPRYAVLDWKSNHLGDHASDYRPARMAAEMAHHAYYLQALIYSVALHRHLRATLSDYSLARHFGGAYYLFVRGVRPDWAAAEPDAPPGLVHWQPSPALIEAVDQLFAQRSAA